MNCSFSLVRVGFRRESRRLLLGEDMACSVRAAVLINMATVTKGGRVLWTVNSNDRKRKELNSNFIKCSFTQSFLFAASIKIKLKCREDVLNQFWMVHKPSKYSTKSSKINNVSQTELVQCILGAHICEWHAMLGSDWAKWLYNYAFAV